VPTMQGSCREADSLLGNSLAAYLVSVRKQVRSGAEPEAKAGGRGAERPPDVPQRRAKRGQARPSYGGQGGGRPLVVFFDFSRMASVPGATTPP